MSWMEKNTQQRWVDSVGCVCAVAFCCSLLVRSAGLGLLLAPTLLHNLLLAASFIMRRAPQARISSLPARASAYGVTVLVPVYLVLAPAPLHLPVPAAVRAAAGIVWLAGSLLGVWGIWNLRYSFSIEPQARDLVTSGPYRFVRHPMYAAYVLQYVGILLARPSIGFALILCAWFLLVCVRMRFEEQVLSLAFPGYNSYRRSVGALFPRFSRRALPAPASPGAIPAAEVH